MNLEENDFGQKTISNDIGMCTIDILAVAVGASGGE